MRFFPMPRKTIVLLRFFEELRWESLPKAVSSCATFFTLSSSNTDEAVTCSPQNAMAKTESNSILLTEVLFAAVQTDLDRLFLLVS